MTEPAHRLHMERALALAREAAAAGEVPIGAVLVAEDRVVGAAHNQPVGRHDPAAHAEILALRQAGERLGNYRLPGTTLYVTLEPCLMCVGAMLQARIARLVYGAADPKVGAVALAGELARRGAVNHAFQVTGGVLGREAGALLQEYFRARRRGN